MKLVKIAKSPIIFMIELAMRVALGCLFIYSALPKIRQPYDFLHDVYNYEIVGPKLGLLVAMVLPWMEFMVGVCLLGGIFISGALLVCMGMAAMFSFVVAGHCIRGWISVAAASAAGPRRSLI
jgi:cobalt-zinc-cadmium efflux system protein